MVRVVVVVAAAAWGARTSLTLSRETVSTNNFGLGPKKSPFKKQKTRFFEDAKLFLFTMSRISSRLVTFGLETDGTRPSRVSSRLVSCCLDLVSSRDFRLVTGSTSKSFKRSQMLFTIKSLPPQVFEQGLFLSSPAQVCIDCQVSPRKC